MAAAGATAVLVAVVVAAGCSSDPPTLDRAETEQAVAAAVADAVAPPVAGASCPGRLVAAEGERFACTAELRDVGTVRVAVDQPDGDGELRVRLRDAVLADAAVAAQVKAELADRFERSFQVDCGDHPWRVWQPGDTFPCRARDRDGRRSVDVTVLDAAGTLRIEVLRPSN